MRCARKELERRLDRVRRHALGVRLAMEGIQRELRRLETGCEPDLYRIDVLAGQAEASALAILDWEEMPC